MIQLGIIVKKIITELKKYIVGKIMYVIGGIRTKAILSIYAHRVIRHTRDEDEGA